MKMKKVTLLVVLVLVAMLIMVACTPSEVSDASESEATQNEEQATETEGQSEDGLKFAFVVKNQTNPVFVAMADGIQNVCDANGIELVVQSTESEAEVDQQIQLLQTLLTQDFDALLVTPLSSTAIVPFVKECNDAGMPIILVDTGADKEALEEIGAKVDFFVTVDNEYGGLVSGQALVDALDGEGKIAILNGSAGSSTAVAINDGFYGALEGTNIEVVAEQAADWNRNKGYDVFSTILTANPDLNGVLAANDEMALGAIKAIADAGLEGQIYVIGLNYVEDAKQAILDGTMLGSADKKPILQGSTAAERTIQLLNGESIPEEEMIQPVFMDASNVE